nr:junction-mediating and -regulatory protein-like isoform X2 [Vicugna pacos]
MAQRQRSGTSGQVYLGHDLDTCGWKILSQEFFTETHDREYYEPLASCSRRARKRIQERTAHKERGMEYKNHGALMERNTLTLGNSRLMRPLPQH